MNDFTKEELEYLRSCPSVGCYDGLYEKIQSMIDNYCESDDYVEPILYSQKHCEKCNQLVFGGFPCPCTLSIRGI